MGEKEELIKKAIKKLKEKYPGMPAEQLKKELIPLEGKEVGIRVGKKRKKKRS